MVVISVPYLSLARGHQGPVSEHTVKKELQRAGSGEGNAPVTEVYASRTGHLMEG